MTIAMSLARIPTVPVGDIEVPHDLRGLYDLAYNLWWTTSPRAQQLFATIDSVAWSHYHNPVQLLINVEPTRWEQLRGDETFGDAYASVIRDFERYRDDGSWFARAHPDYAAGPVAYFSMEYGLHESLPFYAGGLGVLSGDHLKSASDLGLPLVGIGLLYGQGYFHQTVDADGWQQHTYFQHDFTRLPVRPVAGTAGGRLVVRVPFPGREVLAEVWVAQVGRTPLLLLTTNVAGNDPADRPITNILYVATPEMRLAQEFVLGVGGVRVLRALGIEPAAWHMNEGHSAFLQLERLRELGGVTAPGGLDRISADAVFTTHTPVPAGNERYDRALVRKYVEDEAFLALGDSGDGAPEAPFNMTALGIRTSRFVNAVSVRNAEVCDAMWRRLRPELPAGTPLVRPITNGVHTPTWLGRAFRDLFQRYLGVDWPDLLLDPEVWNRVYAIPDEEVWAAHVAQKERFTRFVRKRLRDQLARHGRAPDELRAVEGWFDPQALTIGFARRFATYKRAGLLLSQPQRLAALVGSSDRPVQIVFSGKAHPADRPGQHLIRQTVLLSQDDALRGRMCFLESYDLRVAGMLVQGVDVWLNTPRPPLEASGTSGQKAAANGALNVSVADGWWPEAYDRENGWVIAGNAAAPGEVEQDRADAEDLYRILEQEVVPQFYQRDERGVPRAWVARMKRAIVTVAPRFSASRMVRDYAEQAYMPAARAP